MTYQEEKDRNESKAKRWDLVQQIEKNIAELNKIDAGEWIHIYNTLDANGEFSVPKKKDNIPELNKILVKAASEILKVTVELEK